MTGPGRGASIPVMRAFACCIAAAWLAGCSGSAPAPAAPGVRFGEPPYAAVDPDGAPIEGPADAWVTIVEFLDYACPYCAGARPVLEELLAAHPQDVRLVAKMFPVHGDLSARAARAALCAHRQGLFWPMHESLFDHRPDFSDQQVASYAAAIPGMDAAAWQECYASAAALQAVSADAALGESIGVGGTPTFVVNGKLVVGAYPLGAMEELVQRAQAAAEASGVPRAEYYDTVILDR